MLALVASYTQSWSSLPRPRAPSRARDVVAFLELYDLMPMMECLKLPAQVEVNACFEGLSPWLQVTKDGSLVLSQGAVAGFTGGSVGAVGTLVATLTKRDQVKGRLKCVYCDGRGIIQCGRCLGSSQLASVNGATGELSYIGCSNCEASGSVLCISARVRGTPARQQQAPAASVLSAPAAAQIARAPG